MVSSTKQTWRIRDRRRQNAGRRRKRREGKLSTPVFPIHPPGYDPNAPDAKRTPGAD
jgi:hypothetical protein